MAGRMGNNAIGRRAARRLRGGRPGADTPRHWSPAAASDEADRDQPGNSVMKGTDNWRADDTLSVADLPARAYDIYV